MRVRKHYTMHTLGVKVGEISVNPQLILTVPLVHTAIKQYALAVYLQQMLGSRCCLSCSAKMYFHGFLWGGYWFYPDFELFFYGFTVYVIEVIDKGIFPGEIFFGGVKGVAVSVGHDCAAAGCLGLVLRLRSRAALSCRRVCLIQSFRVFQVQ